MDLPAGRIPHGVIRDKAANGAWPRSFGPAPGQPGCLIPPGVLAPGAAGPVRAAKGEPGPAVVCELRARPETGREAA